MNTSLIWLRNWMIFCVGLIFVYNIFRFFGWLHRIIWIKKIKKRHLLIKRFDKFGKRYGNKVSFDKFKEYINNIDFKHLPERPAWFELYEKEKIIFFEIPWGEVYCVCNDNEFSELIENIDYKFKASLLNQPKR